jgi:predicted DNA-binding transcriptional regulator AlpA
MSKADFIMSSIQINKPIVTTADLLPSLPFSGSTLKRKVKDGTFPKPFKVTKTLNAWRLEQIQAWFDAQGVGA